MKKRTVYSATAVLTIFSTLTGSAQLKDSTAKLTFGGYVDAYYASYDDSLTMGAYQKFAAVSPKSDEFGLNAAMISAQYTAAKVRGVVALQYGDISKVAWSPAFSNIVEANAGVKLTNRVWVDAGFFRGHMGIEKPFPNENIASSIAVPTLYQSRYESGVRLSYNENGKLSLRFFLLNGYNRFDDNNRRKSFGMKIKYKLGDKGSIAYANYVGDDTPAGLDTISHSRKYHNLVLNYLIIPKLKMQLSFDYASQKNSNYTDPAETAAATSGLLALKYQLKERIAVYGRGEIFNDPQGFLSGIIVDRTGKNTGLISMGGTIGAEFKPTENSYIRIEGRQIQMQKDQDIFTNNGHTINRRELLLNFGISF